MANRFLSNIKINDAYTFPASDGTNGQVIKTDGSGNLSFAQLAADSASVMYKDTFTGNGSTTSFTLANALNDEVQSNVYIDGVYQSKSTYSVSGTTLTFSTAPASGHEIEVISTTGINSGPTAIYTDNFTGNGSATAFTLGQTVHNENQTLVFLNGVYQFKNTYTLSGTTLTLDAAPANGVAIEVMSIGSAYSGGDILYDHDFGSAGLMTTNGSGVYSITANNSANWNTAYGWGDHSTQSYATQSYVGTQISNLVDSSPATLNTLNELAAALGDDPNFATTTANSIGLKAPLASPSFTGNATFAGNVNLGDNDKLQLGAGNDLQIYHNGNNDRGYIYNATGDLYIENDATDGDIKFFSDNGSGGTDEYFRLDGGIASLMVNKDILMYNDGANGKLKFGASQDLQIYHDGSHSYIDHNGTGDLRIKSSAALALLSSANEDMILAVPDSFVKLYHNGIERLATTSTGIEVSGTSSTFAGDVVSNAIVQANGFRTTTGSTDYSLLSRNSANTAVYIQQAGTGNIVDFRYGSQAAGQGTSAMIIDDSGNVGIGTTSPNFKLDIVNAAANAATYQQFRNGTTGTASSDGTVLGIDADGDFLINNQEAKEIKLYTNDTQRLTIQSGGNVGIGTTSPTEKLDVEGNIQAIKTGGGSVAYIDVVSGATWRFASNPISGTNAYGLNIIKGSAGTDVKMSIDTNGNVGIGTTSPNAILEIASGNSGGDAALDAPVFRINNTTQSSDWDVGDVVGSIEYYTSDASGNAPYVASFIKSVNETGNGTLPDGALTFGTATYNASGGAVERMRINSGGTVEIINSTSPKLRLTRGAKQYTSRVDNNNKFVIQEEGGNEFFVVESGASSSSIRINSSGNLAIGTTSSAERVTIAGVGSLYPNIKFTFPGVTSRFMKIGMVSATKYEFHVNGSGTYMSFATEGTEKMRIEPDGTVRVKTGSIVVDTAGQGIYLGGTAVANKLDDYEEGSWTPQIYYQNATDQSNATNVVQQGKYTKIGNLVFVQFRLDFSQSSSSPANDNIGVKNLPFAGANNHYAGGGNVITSDASSNGYNFALPNSGSTIAVLNNSGNIGNYGDQFGSGSNKYIRGSFTYLAQ